jgi:MFS family permease
LNWPLGLKIACLLQVSVLAALGGLNTAIISTCHDLNHPHRFPLHPLTQVSLHFTDPAYVPMAKELHISTVRASYQTTIVIAINGLAPFLWLPLANVYGRRPMYLFCTLLGFGTALGSAYAKTFSQLLAARAFNGFMPVAFTLGAATVVDLFFFHQRGRAMGVYTVTMVNGSHLAPIVGGLVGQYLGWRWCFKMAAIFDGVMFVILFFCLPETLYVRYPPTQAAPAARQRLGFQSYLHRLKLWTRHPDLKLRLSEFVIPSVKMMKYPSVIFPALYYASQYGFSSILPAVTVTSIFTRFFHWNTLDIGLAYGAALTIGGSLGELCAGVVVDAIVKREKRKLGGRDPEPEVRLKAIWTGEILVPSGLLIYGFCLQYRTVWIAPILGMGIACFGLQVITTTCYTYAIDCYRPEGSEVSQVFNFFRQEIGMTFAFYVIKMADDIGYQWTFFFFACMVSIDNACVHSHAQANTFSSGKHSRLHTHGRLDVERERNQGAVWQTEERQPV